MRSFWTLLVLVGSMLVIDVAAQSDRLVDIRAKVVMLKDGTRIHLLEAGQPSGAPPVVFIPGWTFPAALWTPQIRRFSRDRLVIAIDPRSQGESSKTELGNTPEQRARDLREVLSMLHISQAVLVGWSQGAQDVAAYVQQFGTDSVAALAFVDSPVSAGPSEIELNKEWSRSLLGMLGLYVNHPAEYSDGMVRSMFKKPRSEAEIEALVAHSRKTPVSTGLTMLVTDIFTVDRRPALAKIDKPALVIAAADSPLLEAQRRMAAAIASAQFVVVQGTGHAVFVDDPDTFNQALEKLLESVPAPQAPS